MKIDLPSGNYEVLKVLNFMAICSFSFGLMAAVTSLRTVNIHISPKSHDQALSQYSRPDR